MIFFQSNDYNIPVTTRCTEECVHGDQIATIRNGALKGLYVLPVYPAGPLGPGGHWIPSLLESERGKKTKTKKKTD